VQGGDDRAEAAVPFTVLVNPKVTPLSEEMLIDWEGCLSVPDLRGPVPRVSRVRLDALDSQGKPWSVEASGFHARVIQHECDHLDGLVFLDRMADLRGLSFQKEFEAYVLGAEEP
jgi:peptide deformylase